MMDLKKIENVIKLMREYGLHELEVADGDFRVKLVQAPSSSSVPFYQTTAPHMHAPLMPMAPAPVARHGDSSTAQKENLAAIDKKKFKEVRSPFVGTFYACPAPGADPFVTVGKRVKKGTSLCIIEAMKLMNEIEADSDGVIVEILVESGHPVEYDQVLFLME